MTVCRPSGRLLSGCSRPFQGSREGVEGKRTQQVTAQAAFDLGESVGGQRDPGEIGRVGELFQFAQDVGVANQFRRAGVEKRQILEQGIERAEQGLDFLAAFGAGAIGFRNLEKLAVVGGAQRGMQNG